MTPEAAVGEITNLNQLKNLLLPGMYRYSSEDVLTKGAVYPQIFKRRMSTFATETVAHYALPPLGLAQVKVHDEPVDPPGQHFVYNATHMEKNLLFAVVPNDDPRATSVSQASFVREIDTLRKLKPMRASEFRPAMEEMLRINRETRENEAAAIFNNANVYDPIIGGDGVSMCSTNHPHDRGCWINTFPTQQDLSATSLEAAVALTKQMVDDAGLRIHSNVKALLVPRKLAATGLAVVAESPSVNDLIVWDCLKYKHWWFLLTDIDGLTHFIRAPFEVQMWVDIETEMLLVKSRYRDVFTYIDPRAVFGSMPLE